MNIPPRQIRALAITFLAFAALVPAASAETITVEVNGDFSDTDGNGCALREAVRSANEGTSIGGCDPGEIGPDTIRIPAGNYPLTIDGIDNGTELGDLDVSDKLKIIGLGKGAVIDGGGAGVLDDRIFDLRLGDVKMQNLTIQGGRTTQGAGYHGGGILGDDSVSIDLRDVKLLNNDGNGPSVRGGAISADGPLEITDSVISGNNSPFYGGIDAGGGLFMERTTVSDNEAAFGAGGLFLADPAFITGSTFSENRLEGETGTHNGGAIATVANTNIRNTTIAGNTADQGGGGIAAFSSADVYLTNVTVTDNTADLNLDTTNPADGGGIYSENGGMFRLRNTVISGNRDLTPQGDGDIQPNCAAQVTLAGNNLLGDTEGCATQKLSNTPAEIPDGTNPKLGELAMNGGPTATVSFAKASPLRDRIKASKCDDAGVSKLPEITEDQRGVPRPQKGRCDVGAYERATCKGALVNRVGTASGDRIKGAQSDDGILGLAGKDKLKGKDGKDGLCGAEGKDKLAGGANADRLIGGPGADKLVGGPGFDVCVGGPGKDVAVDCEEVKGV